MRRLVHACALGALIAMASGVAIASTCPVATTFAALQSAGSCSEGGIDFSGFTITGTAAANTISVALSQTGEAGFTFSIGGGQSSPFLISYTASCASAAACINDVHDSVTSIPAGGGSYFFSALIGSGLLSSSSQVWNDTFTNSHSVVNTGTFLGGAVNQSMTLDVTYSSPQGTPEPSTAWMAAAGIALIGIVRRRRTA